MTLNTFFTGLRDRFFPTTTEAALEPLDRLKKQANVRLGKVVKYHDRKANAAYKSIDRDDATIGALRDRQVSASYKAEKAREEAIRARQAKDKLAA